MKRMARPTARIVVHNEVSIPVDPAGWALCFQKCTYNYSDRPPLDGFRFIRRKPNGSLHVPLGQALIPSVRDIQILLTKAKRDGWAGNDGSDY